MRLGGENSRAPTPLYETLIIHGWVDTALFVSIIRIQVSLGFNLQLTIPTDGDARVLK